MASTISINSQFDLTRGGSAELAWIQNHCRVCGWVGKQHYAYENYQHVNCKEERHGHKCMPVLSSDDSDTKVTEV